VTRRHPADIERAAEMTLRGVPQKQIAAEIGCSTKQIQRWAKDPRYEKLFAPPPEPGSLEHRRSVLLRALETGSLGEQLRAVELLEKLGANEKRASGSGRITVYVGEHETCPKCGHRLTGVFRGGNKP
jgi:hypothetical protein